MAKAGQLAQQLSLQPVQAVATSAPQNPVQLPPPQLPDQPAAALPAHSSSLTEHQPDLVAASPGIDVPVQALTSSTPYVSAPVHSFGSTRLPAQTSLPAATQPAQRDASSAGQGPDQAGVSVHVQRYPAQSSAPAAGQHSRLDDIATTVMASMHPAARLGRPAVTYSPERFPSMPGVSSPVQKPALPQSPFKMSSLVSASLALAGSAAASQQAPGTPGQRAAQAARSIERSGSQANGTNPGRDKLVADHAEAGSKDKPLTIDVQPHDGALGSGPPSQLSQQSQQGKSPFKSVLRSPLHHEKPWEDTDDEDGEPNEVDWERHITASAAPEPAGARSASVANEHRIGGAAPLQLSRSCRVPNHPLLHESRNLCAIASAGIEQMLLFGLCWTTMLATQL